MLRIINRVIAVDICNTLADVNLELEKRLGKTPTPEVYFHPALLDKKYFIEQNLDIFVEAKPIYQSIEKLNKIAKVNKIVYITARPKVAEEATVEWLKRNGYPKGEIFFSKNKTGIASTMGVDLAIDDAPFEIESYIKAGIDVLVKEQPYNKKYSNRFSWEAI